MEWHAVLSSTYVELDCESECRVTHGAARTTPLNIPQNLTGYLHPLGCGLFGASASASNALHHSLDCWSRGPQCGN
eukprot:6129217-Prymnesium_polylepis.1